MIEEYASKEACDAHTATQPVQDLIALFTNGNVLESPPEVYNHEIIHDKIAKISPTVASDPAILLAHFSYKPGMLSHALQGWKSVVDYVTENEDGTLGYTVLASDSNDVIRTVEIYEGWDFVDNVHLKSPAITQIKERNAVDTTELPGAIRLKAVDGFLGRVSTDSKIEAPRLTSKLNDTQSNLI